MTDTGGKGTPKTGAQRRRPDPGTLRAVRPDVLIAAVLCLAVAGGLAIESRREHRLQRANDAGLARNTVEAAQLAADAQSGPTRPRALHTEGLAHLAGGRIPRATVALRAAAEAAPFDWRVRRDWAIALLRAGDRRAAQVQISRAYALNPLLQPPPGFGN